MARYKGFTKKARLAKQGKRTKWAPFWIVLKALPKGKKVHPAQFTRIKRQWRRGKIQQIIKGPKRGKEKFISGYKRKKM